MRYDNSHITYHAAVTVYRPGLASNKLVKVPFEVAVNYATMYSSPALAYKEKKLNFRSKDQVVAITVLHYTHHVLFSRHELISSK